MVGTVLANGERLLSAFLVSKSKLLLSNVTLSRALGMNSCAEGSIFTATAASEIIV